MVILTSLPGLFETGIFLLAVAAFAMAFRFFVNSRRRLHEAFPGIVAPAKQFNIGLDRSGFLIPQKTAKKTKPLAPAGLPPVRTSASDNTKEDIRDLKSQLKQQQQELARAMQQISLLSQQGASNEKKEAAAAESREMANLKTLLDRKEAELQRLKSQDMYTQKLHERLEEVQTEFEHLQEKMMEMEQQAWQAAELNIQLEHAGQSQLQAEKMLLKKEERLRELAMENQQLRDSFSELEDKLSEANMQRQQLLKKVQLLEGLNTDMMQIAEANRKLKTEMARMSELESMLQLMTESRSGKG
jgi:chromosome segregation ATPase